ncbi:hypothetical protein BVRB_9g204420 [Beta vulgaris subsp. vulgaris]|nr:hypothetical protein BVRB_9g204420 [Beta vulgaris subsp. vulgaris]
MTLTKKMLIFVVVAAWCLIVEVLCIDQGNNNFISYGALGRDRDADCTKIHGICVKEPLNPANVYKRGCEEENHCEKPSGMEQNT